ncbi:hypothetical protein HYO62_02885 [Aerococcaceae bacterium DSM 111022]|nr:hypothetical protein [Aerococcaceae bacterium DSM 111022]
MITKESVLRTLIENSIGLTGERAVTARKAVAYVETSDHVLDFEQDLSLERETKKMITVAVKDTKGTPRKDYPDEVLISRVKGTTFEDLVRDALNNRN